MKKPYRPQIPFPLGFDMGKPVPVPEGFENGNTERSTYTKNPENRDIKGLKPFKKDLKNG